MNVSSKLKDSYRHYRISSLQAFFIVSVGIGVLIRLIAMKGMPIGADEYYFYKSITAIKETGLPLIGNSGYYIRGILVQYLITPLTFLIEDFQIAGRIVPSLFNILSGYILYRIARDFFNHEVGFIATALFFLSLWQIEFSRYTRMYTAFEFIFLASCYLILQLNEQPNVKKVTNLALLAFASIFVFEGAIFLIALTSAIYIVRSSYVRIWHWMILGVALLFYLAQLLIDWRHIYELNTFLPEDFIYSYSKPVIDFPKQLLITLPNALSPAIAILFTAASAIYFYKLRARDTQPDQLRTATENVKAVIFHCAILLSIATNQVGLSICILLINYLSSLSLSWQMTQPRREHIYVIITAFSIYLLCFLITGIPLRQSLIAVLKYPNIFDSVLYPWIDVFSLPFFLVATVLSFTTFIFTSNKINRSFALIILIVFVTILMVGITNTAYNSTRYTFFLHPLILLIFSYVVVKIFPDRKRLRNLGYIAAIAIYSTMSGDISAKHVININSESIVYRLPYEENKSVHLINRKEFKSLIDFLEKNVKPGDIVISEAHEFDYWYEKPFYRYVGIGEVEFPSYSSSKGIVEFWSRNPLLKTLSEVTNIATKEESNIWFVFYIHRNSKMYEQLASMTKTNFDSTLGVVNLAQIEGVFPRAD